MRQGQQNRNRRGRNNNHNHGQHHNRRGQNPLSRNYESNGPGVKIRGNAAHVAEKYISLARDALSAGDNIMAENYLQHAEHYNRIIMAAQQPQEGAGQGSGMNPQRPRPYPNEMNTFDDDADGESDEHGQAGVQPAGNGHGATGGYQSGMSQGGMGPGGPGALSEGGYSQGQPQGYAGPSGYGQQPQHVRNGYGQRHDGQPRHDGHRGDRFHRDRHRDNRGDRGDQRHREDGSQQPRSQQRHEGRPYDSRQDGRHEGQGRFDGRHDQGRGDSYRQGQDAYRQGQDSGRIEQPRQLDYAQQPQPVIAHEPVPAATFEPEGPVTGPTYGADVANAPETSFAREMPAGAEGDSPAPRRERSGRGQEGYRPQRRRRSPAAMAADSAVNGHSGEEAGASPAYADSSEPPAAPTPRRKPDPEAAGD